MARSMRASVKPPAARLPLPERKRSEASAPRLLRSIEAEAGTLGLRQAKVLEDAVDGVLIA
jgi:hypothetical protein